MVLRFIKEVAKGVIKTPFKRWIAMSIGVAFAFILRYFIVRFYLEYKMSLVTNLYIDNIFLTFIYENNEIVQYHQSTFFIVFTGVLGGMGFARLPWFKVEEEETVENEDFDEDLW